MPLSINTAVELFQGISEAEAQRVERLCTERRYPEGARSLQGRPADALYIVKDGTVRILSLSDKGRKRSCTFSRRARSSGNSSSPRRCGSSAPSPARMPRSPSSRRESGGAAGLHPTVSKNFIRLLSKRLAKVEKEFGDFGHTWSYDRLAKILLKLCEEHGGRLRRGS